jgi:hypothetical protein
MSRPAPGSRPLADHQHPHIQALRHPGSRTGGHEGDTSRAIADGRANTTSHANATSPVAATGRAISASRTPVTGSTVPTSRATLAERAIPTRRANATSPVAATARAMPAGCAAGAQLWREYGLAKGPRLGKRCRHGKRHRPYRRQHQPNGRQHWPAMPAAEDARLAGLDSGADAG